MYQIMNLDNEITNKNFCIFLNKSINYYCGFKDKTFPGPQPVSIEKKNFEKLTKYDYQITLKSNGVRYLMYFLIDKNNNNICVLMNRACKFFNIDISVDESLYKGTIFDGELMEDNTFIIHDCVLIFGNRINKESFSTRLFEITTCLEMMCKSESNIKLVSKKFESFKNIKQFIKENYDPNNKNTDGLIFIPEKLPYICGTQYSMFKWKSITNCTFDFKIMEQENDLEVYVYHSGQMKIFAKVIYNTSIGEKFIKNCKDLENYKNECILECKFENNNFVPLLIRTDKTHPNSLRTVERTLFNINENITLEDFYNI